MRQRRVGAALNQAEPTFRDHGLLATAGVDALVNALGTRRPLADLVVGQRLTAALRGDRSAESRLLALGKAAALIGRMPSEQRARQAARVARELDLDAFRVLDTVQDHVPYDPTPRGPLDLLKAPRLVSQRADRLAERLAANAARIQAIGAGRATTSASGGRFVDDGRVGDRAAEQDRGADGDW